jgi:uncharacterized Zn finger protein (UPF0148 family)
MANYCTGCGRKAEDDAHFCPACGRELVRDQARPEAPAATVMQPAAATPPATPGRRSTHDSHDAAAVETVPRIAQAQEAFQRGDIPRVTRLLLDEIEARNTVDDLDVLRAIVGIAQYVLANLNGALSAEREDFAVVVAVSRTKLARLEEAARRQTPGPAADLGWSLPIAPPSRSDTASASDAAAAAVPSGTNGFAIASLVLGIVWLYGLGSLLAVIFGYMARSEIDASSGRQGGRGLAIAGIVLGWIGLGLILLLLIVGVSLL